MSRVENQTQLRDMATLMALEFRAVDRSPGEPKQHNAFQISWRSRFKRTTAKQSQHLSILLTKLRSLRTTALPQRARSHVQTTSVQTDRVHLNHINCPMCIFSSSREPKKLVTSRPNKHTALSCDESYSNFTIQFILFHISLLPWFIRPATSSRNLFRCSSFLKPPWLQSTSSTAPFLQ